VNTPSKLSGIKVYSELLAFSMSPNGIKADGKAWQKNPYIHQLIMRNPPVQ
jgi:hypothetical protein